jgi:hypothetical protein
MRSPRAVRSAASPQAPSRVTVSNPLSARIRATCVSSRSSSRRFPTAIQVIAATASALGSSVRTSGSPRLGLDAGPTLAGCPLG